MTRNDQMSGGENQLSARRSEFPRVIDHDTPLTKVSVGGPLLNLDRGMHRYEYCPCK